MKILLGFNQNDLSDYRNLGVRKNLDDVVLDNEAEEIYANESIDFIEPENVSAYLDNLCNKLQQGGTLCITGTDINSLISKVYEYQISTQDFYEATRGTNQTPPKFVHLSINTVSSALSSKIKIIKKFYENDRFVIVGVKK